MFILTAKLKRKKVILCAVALTLLTAAALCFIPNGEKAEMPIAADNLSRVAYLESFGWDILPEPVETLTITLPEDLAEPYLSYNTMQIEQGFDLNDYCGETLSRYTYLVTNYPDYEGGCQADLYLCKDTIVAGDIICLGENGQLCPLTYPQPGRDAP